MYAPGVHDGHKEFIAMQCFDSSWSSRRSLAAAARSTPPLSSLQAPSPRMRVTYTNSQIPSRPVRLTLYDAVRHYALQLR
jgi:hypothetical protein